VLKKPRGYRGLTRPVYTPKRAETSLCISCSITGLPLFLVFRTYEYVYQPRRGIQSALAQVVALLRVVAPVHSSDDRVPGQSGGHQHDGGLLAVVHFHLGGFDFLFDRRSHVDGCGCAYWSRQQQ